MTTFSDDFNRADSTALGAGWIEVSGDWSIVANLLSPGAAGGTIILRAATTMASSDHFAQVTIAATTAASQGVWCRGNANISSGYLLRNMGASWDLFSVVGGSFTVIGTYTAAAAPGDVVKVQAVGSAITAYVNSVQRITVTNTAVTTGTSVGIRADSTNGLRFDNFAAADVTAGTSGDATLASTATLSATGQRATAGSSSLAATAGLTAGGLRATTGAADLPTVAQLAAGGIRGAAGSSSLGTAALLAADGTVGTSGTADAAIAAGLAASGVRATQTGGVLTADANLSATGQRVAVAATDVAVAAVLAAQGQVAHTADAALTAVAMLAADGTTGTPPVLADASLNALGALTAAGVHGATAGAARGTTAALVAAGTTAATRGSVLAATATLTASGSTAGSGDDIEFTVGPPTSAWAAGHLLASDWTAQKPQGSGWEVGTPW